MAGGQAEVNWQMVEDELHGISNDFKEQRFDTLPHVVGVLTCADPKRALDALRQQRDAIEVLVDDVVQAYHNGFNKAIRNYSQILKLFSESADLMSGLKLSLADSKKLLGNRHRQLQQLWSRSITLRHIISLVDQIDAVAKVPAKIQSLIAEKKFYAAVQLHLHSLASLDRGGISMVGALKEVRNELAAVKGSLFLKVLEDLQLHLYNRGQYSPKAEADDDDDVSIAKLVPLPVPVSAPLHPSLANQLGGAFNSAAAIRAKPRGIRLKEAGGDTRDGEGEEAADADVADTVVPETSQKAPAVLPPWLQDATGNSFTESMSKRTDPAHVKYLLTMVECLSLLDKFAAAGSIINQRVRAFIRDLILAEIAAKAAAAEAARPRVDQVTKSSHAAAGPIGVNSPTIASSVTSLAPTPRTRPSPLSASSSSFSSFASFSTSSSSSFHSPSPAAAGTAAASPAAASLVLANQMSGFHSPSGPSQALAQELLEATMKSLTAVLENHVIVSDAFDAKVAERAERTDGRRSSEGVESAAQDFNNTTGGYSVAFVWSCMQSECQQLLCDILRASLDGSPDSSASKLDSSGKSAITFSFRFSDTSQTTAGAGADSFSGSLAGSDSVLNSQKRKNQAAAGQQGYGSGAVLPDRGIYLASACYRPTLQFTERVCQVLPRRYAELGRHGLRPFVDSFVKDQFLPAVRSDYRTRAAEALSSPPAFRPKARVLGAYEAAVEAGRPVLMGPLQVEALSEEVLNWARSMPVYASEFVDLIHTLLERTLERCRGVYTEAVLGSLSSGLVSRSDIERLMSRQAAALLLEEGELSMADLEQAKEDPPIDSEAFELENEIYSKLFALQPIKEEQLIFDSSRLVLLAALSDTLEYLADAILRLGRPKPAMSLRRKGSTRNLAAQSSSSGQQPSALTSALGKLAAKYRAFSRECLKTLRLEMQLQAIHHLQSMPQRSYVSDVDAEEPEDFIVALTSQMSRVDEEITVYVAPARRYFIFGGVCGLAATGVIRALADIKEINSLGVRQVQRNCIALQQTLATLNANSSQSVQLSLDRVGEYYELLNRPYEALMAYMKEHNRYFSIDEYSTLLSVKVVGRHVPVDALQRVAQVMQHA